MMTIFKDSSPGLRLLLLLGVFLLSLLLGAWTALAVWGGTGDALSSLKWMQLVQSVAAFVAPPVVVAWLCGYRPVQALQLDRSPGVWPLVAVVALMVAAVPAVNLLGAWNASVTLPSFLADLEAQLRLREAQAAEATARLLATDTWGGLAANLLVVAMVPALGEEMFFRGALQGLLCEWGGSRKWGVWVAAAVFSAVHMQFYGFIPRLLMGAVFGYLLLWSGSLWLPVAAHGVNNACIVVYYFLLERGCRLPDLEALGTGHTGWVGVACGAACVGLLLLVSCLCRREGRSAYKTGM